MGEVRTVSTVITQASGFSAGIALQLGEIVCAVQTDATWDATTDIGIDVSQDNTTFTPVVDASRAVTAPVSSDFRFLYPVQLSGVAVINTYPKLNLPYSLGTSFFRLRALTGGGAGTASNVTAPPAANRTVVVYITTTDG